MTTENTSAGAARADRHSVDDLDACIAEIHALAKAITELTPIVGAEHENTGRRLEAIVVTSTMIAERLDQAEAYLEGVNDQPQFRAGLFTRLKAARSVNRQIAHLAEGTDIAEARLSGIGALSADLEDCLEIAVDDIDHHRRPPRQAAAGVSAGATSATESLDELPSDIMCGTHDTLCLAYLIEDAVQGMLERASMSNGRPLIMPVDRKKFLWLVAELVDKAERADALAEKLDGAAVSRVRH